MGARTYRLWWEGPWELPQPSKTKESAPLEESKKESQVAQLASTKNIVANNLFDPERGTGSAPAEASSAATQRIQRMILVGTVILGTSRYAILQDPSDPGPGLAKGQSRHLRLKLGDTVDGFRLSEIHEKKVVFTSGASKLDVSLDFLRKPDEAAVKAATPVPAGPRPAPRVPPRSPAGQAPATP